MAGEINISVSVIVNKAPTLVNEGVSYGFAQDMAGKYKEETIQTFTTTPAAFRIGSITAVGYVVVKNTAVSGGNLLVSNGSGGAAVPSIPPGGVAMFPSATNTLFGAASAGTIDAKLTVFEA